MPIARPLRNKEIKGARIPQALKNARNAQSAVRRVGGGKKNNRLRAWMVVKSKKNYRRPRAKLIRLKKMFFAHGRRNKN